MQNIKKRLLTLLGVSPLAFEDEELFRIAFPKDSIQYARSWLYILRASHGDDGALGYKFVHANLIAIIGYRNGNIYITPIIDKTHGVMLQKICQSISEVMHCQIIIKKFYQTAHDQFPTSRKTSDVNSILEDDSFPERILQLNTLFISEKGDINPAAKTIIRTVRKIDKTSANFYTVDDIRLISKEKIMQFLSKNKEKYSSYSQIVSYLFRSSNQYKYKTLIFLDKGNVRGLYIGELFSLTEMGLYCAVTSKDVPGITEWMDIYFFRKMLFEGIQTIYFGGSESQGIAEYINKLLPYKPHYFVEAILYNHSRKEDDPLVLIRPINEDDFNALAEIYKKVYNSMDDLGEHWTKEIAHRFISYFYKRQPDLFFLAEDNNKTVGAIVAGIQPWWDGNHLVNGEVFIDPTYQGKGLGKKLLKHLLTTSRKKYQAVAWDTIMPNIDGHPLNPYQKFGFTKVPYWEAISGDIHTLLKRLEG